MDALPWILGGSNLFCAALCIALAVPLVKRRVKPNHCYGVRFRKSFESDELWYDINAFGARGLIVWSIPLALVGLATLVLPLGRPAVIATAFAPLVLVIPAIESYLYSRRL